MKEFSITTLVKECTVDELTAADRELVAAAREATRRSYAPYSKFHVGAAIRMADDTIVTGANQENAAYPSGICAERTAAFYASASHPGMAMKKIAIAAWTNHDKPSDLPWEEYFQAMPISPCGACRQALLEYETKYGNIEVILNGKDKTYIFPSVGSLLPFSFTEF
ncbi:MAG: cytidine deaminase [Bacteroides sp.]|nr:cytidine deaminase [Bacteroides sp.]